MHSRDICLGSIPATQAQLYKDTLAAAARAAAVSVETSTCEHVATDIIRVMGVVVVERTRPFVELSVHVAGGDPGSVADYSEWFLGEVRKGISLGTGPGKAYAAYVDRIARWCVAQR